MEMTVVGIGQLLKDVVQGAELWALRQAKTSTKKISGTLKGAKAADLLVQEIEKNDQLLPVLGQYMDLPIVDMVQGSSLYKSLIKQAVERGYYLVEAADEWLGDKIDTLEKGEDGAPDRSNSEDLPAPELNTVTPELASNGMPIEPAQRPGPVTDSNVPVFPQGNDPGAGVVAASLPSERLPSVQGGVDTKGDANLRNAGVPQADIDAAKSASEKAGMNEDGLVSPKKPKETLKVEQEISAPVSKPSK